MSKGSRRPRHQKTRPNLEHLEDRSVPASLRDYLVGEIPRFALGDDVAPSLQDVATAVVERPGGRLVQGCQSLVHLTSSSRDLLSRFFKVQPGYLVSDLPDYSTNLLTDMDYETDRLGTWLMASAEEWRSEPLIQKFLTSLANVEDPRRYFALFYELMDLSVDKLENIVHMIKTVENA